MARPKTLQQLEDRYDPTDADRAMGIAASALRLLRVCQRILFAENAGLRVGRDDSIELAVKMRELGERMHLLDSRSTEECMAFHRQLEIEAGLNGEAHHDDSTRS